MSSYTHGGYQQIARSVKGKAIDPNYTDEEIIEVLRSKNSLFLARTRGPIDLVKRVNEAFVKSWEKVTTFPYLILHAQWGYTGGLSKECRSLDHVLNEGLPIMVKRMLQTGVGCNFVPAVATNHLDRVRNRIFQLQREALAKNNGNC